jgi:hypothetical protein
VFVTLVIKMEERTIAQRYAIFFCVKLGDIATTTHGKLQQAFGDVKSTSLSLAQYIF